jgi:hypothetical protein
LILLSGIRFPFRFSLQAGFLVAFLAEFPDHALGPEFTISARVRARLAVLQTFLAIAYLHFLAFYIGFTIGVDQAIHGRVTSLKNRNFLLSGTGVSTMKTTNKSREEMQ